MSIIVVGVLCISFQRRKNKMIYCTIKGKKYQCQFNSDNLTFTDVEDKKRVLVVSYDTPISSLIQFNFF